MRAYPATMGIRPLFALLLAIAALFAAAVSGSAVASAATMSQDMQMMETGHCSSMPSKEDGKEPMNSCCIAMCASAVAVVPSAAAGLPVIQQPPATSLVVTSYRGYLGEIATPPPRLA